MQFAVILYRYKWLVLAVALLAGLALATIFERFGTSDANAYSKVDLSSGGTHEFETVHYKRFGANAATIESQKDLAFYPETASPNRLYNSQPRWKVRERSIFRSFKQW